MSREKIASRIHARLDIESPAALRRPVRDRISNASPRILFVYGTLRRSSDHDMARRLGGEASFLGTARTRGRLIDLGKYPGLVIDDCAESFVGGDLFALHDPAAILASLDDYEGCGARDMPPFEFERRVIDALRENGSHTRAWVYAYTGAR